MELNSTWSSPRKVDIKESIEDLDFQKLAVDEKELIILFKAKIIDTGQVQSRHL